VANRDPAGLYLGEQEEPLVSVMCAPLKTEHRLLGAILLVHAQPDCYTAGDLKLLNAIALQVGPALEIAALTQVALEKARMERELQMAREVQITLLPEKTPVLPCWEFATYWQPAREVAGDYYDFIPETDGQLGMVIADVADKGIGAALFMVFTRSALRASLDPTLTPGQAVQKANRLMCAEADNGLFTTLFYARLDPATGQAACVNAGHNPAILCRPSSGEVRLIRRTGMALGVMEEAVYEQTDLQLAPGDFLLLYTDGVTEAVDEAFHEFGMERLLQTVNDVRQASPREILTALAQAVEAHTGGAPPMDDVTLVIARRV
jgi:serine phosphatase RsbU (regulator of sigma subunit)